MRALLTFYFADTAAPNGVTELNDKLREAGAIRASGIFTAQARAPRRIKKLILTERT
jgi:hypothetical protein